MTELIAIAIGGACGSVARYLMSNAMYAWLGRDFPWGTLTVNIVGSLLMGWLYVQFSERADVSPALRLGLVTGVLGALTTFSTFSLETVALLERGQLASAFTNVTVSVVVCVALCWCGIWGARPWL